MSDVVRDFILIADRRWPSKKECVEAIKALDAERDAHAKQLSLAEVKISNLRAEHAEEVADGKEEYFDLEHKFEEAGRRIRQLEAQRNDLGRALAKIGKD